MSTSCSWSYWLSDSFNEVQTDRHGDPMLWQEELFLALKIDGGRLGGSREVGVDFHRGGGVEAPLTLQFERSKGDGREMEGWQAAKDTRGG